MPQIDKTKGKVILVLCRLKVAYGNTRQEQKMGVEKNEWKKSSRYFLELMKSALKNHALLPQEKFSLDLDKAARIEAITRGSGSTKAR